MSKVKSSAIASEVSTAAEVSATEVETTVKKGGGLEKGVKEKMTARLLEAVKAGELTFEKVNETTMTTTSSTGKVYTMTLHEEASERATTAGVSRFARIIGESKDAEGNVIARTPKLNAREIWEHCNPEYKFPSRSGKAKVDPNKPKRIAKPKAPSVVHSIDDMI
jgi:hypothetical protein